MKLGSAVSRPAILDKDLADEIKSLADKTTDGFATITGKTMGADDFYEGKTWDGIK